MTLLRPLMLVGLCLIGTNACAAQGAQGESLMVGGLKRSYEIHLPPAHNTPSSLLLVFHGGGGRALQVAKVVRINDLADRNNFIVVYPEGVSKHWNDGRPGAAHLPDDVQFISTLIDALGSRHAIDKNRIFATGISNGGTFSQRLACDLSDKIAAVASVAGLMPVALSQKCNPTQPVSVLMLQGTQDPYMPVDGGASPMGRGLGGEVLSAKDSLAFWGSEEGCQGLNVQSGKGFSLQGFAQCRNHTGVGLYLLDGGGHTWPGSHHNVGFRMGVGSVSYALDANQAIMDFFLRHPKEAALK